jgi:uncharacterized protein YndB with AHSA1/START domain
MSDKPQFVYVTYIRATPEKVWAALTDPQTIKKFWFGITAESDFKPGSPWALKFEDGSTADTGEILEAVPPRRLVIRWLNEKPELKAEGWSRCTMEIETAEYYPDFGGKAVKLTITHELESGTGGTLIEAVSGGWPKVLANLKSLLETGDIAFQ